MYPTVLSAINLHISFKPIFSKENTGIRTGNWSLGKTTNNPKIKSGNQTVRVNEL